MNHGMMAGLQPRQPQAPSPGIVTLDTLSASLERIAGALEQLVGLLEAARKEAGK